MLGMCRIFINHTTFSKATDPDLYFLRLYHHGHPVLVRLSQKGDLSDFNMVLGVSQGLFKS